MAEVYVVVVEHGIYSEYGYDIDGVYATEADAVTRVVRDLGGHLSDSHSRGGYAWEVDYRWAKGRWGGGWDPDEMEWVERSPDAPDWWESDFDVCEPIVCRIRRMEVIGG